VILLFAGAGASAAVNPEHYPTTLSFFERLPEQLRKRPLYDLVDQLLRRRTSQGPRDIEMFIGILQELREFSFAVTNADTAVGWFVHEERFARITGAQGNFGQFRNIVSNASREIEQVLSSVNSLVYDLYGIEPEPTVLSQTWTPLLEMLKATSKSLEIFTTNYDVVIERAVVETRIPIATGRVGAVHQYLDLALWEQRRPQRVDDRQEGLLTKLHGSVNWFRRQDEDRIYIGPPLFAGRHERHAIIYPGAKGPPTTRPFDLFHRHLADSAAIAALAVFVGYAFRDDPINTVLRERLPQQCKVVVINPSAELPLELFRPRPVQHIAKPFGTDALRELSSAV
jgi:hypothetical protein